MLEAKTISRVPYLSVIANDYAQSKAVTHSKTNPYFVDYDEPYLYGVSHLSVLAVAKDYAQSKAITHSKTDPYFVDYDEPYHYDGKKSMQ